MKNNNKWIKEYIDNINLNDIKWIKLNASKLNIFFNDNYLDKEIWQYVYDKDANKLFPTPLGMSYINFNSPINDKTSSFLLGIVDNNIKKKTIIAATIYLDEYYLFTDQIQPLTYIITAEVNYYFRNLGIYKKMCKELYNYIKLNQHILTTRESELGKICHTYKILKESLLASGFNQKIFEDNNCQCNQELYNLLCSKTKILK